MELKTNLELKYFYKDPNPIRKVLRSIGAKKESIKKQKDYFFHLPKEKNSKIPSRLKLRLSDGEQRLVFYKRPSFSTANITPSDVVVLPVKDKKILYFLSKALGLKVIVEKQRELWRKGNTVFHLDKVKGVGNVFEIEVWARSKTLKQDQVNFERYKEKLLPYLDKIITGSNEDLVLKLKNK
jgi:predicted adenylyl cyclase CyaB